MSLHGRISALEATQPLSADPVLMLVEFVGATDGKPNGEQTEWDAPASAVEVQGIAYSSTADVSARAAVARIVAAEGLSGAVVCMVKEAADRDPA
jgi:saccharopine dehydrogenase-like NADP-dependent oxidoreductase